MVDDRLYSVQNITGSDNDRLSFMIRNMGWNKAYRYAVAKTCKDPDCELLEEYRERFRRYRKSWRHQPLKAIELGLHHDSFAKENFTPLCVDIETASICDLACPFCYRQLIATPDKLIKEDFYYKVIDQCVELGVPSIKLNWRGEPLLHPKLPQFVDYAKKSGILDVIINTNAVTLSEEKSSLLIEAGLDFMIYSFDGGSKETYEKMRVGRFKENHFEQVYKNIRRFAEIRREMGSVFPRTKIQMIVTKETLHEKDDFIRMFSGHVDEISAKAYSERGGKLEELDETTTRQLKVTNRTACNASSIYMRDINDVIFVSSGRLPCEQPFQRLLITYDGRVSMCCYDWGCEYPVGYLDSQAIDDGDRDYQNVIEKARKSKRGFKLLSKIKMPERYISPRKEVQTLWEIWYGEHINRVREMHIGNRIDGVPVCVDCPFCGTYCWERLG